jgi:hypothetical protein
MFASLFRSQKSRPSETTPLLAALNRYRSHHNGAQEPDEHDDDATAGRAHDNGHGHGHGDDDDDGDDDEENEDRRRDGTLLPVFSSTFLGSRYGSMRLGVSANRLF